MRILILGAANSIWIKNYIDRVLLSQKHEIYLASVDYQKSEFDIFYKENSVHIINIGCQLP